MDRLTFMLGLNIIKEYSHMFFFPPKSKAAIFVLCKN